MRRTVLVADVIDGSSFRISSGMTVVLQGIQSHNPLTMESMKAKAQLEEYLLHKHVQMEEIETDATGRIVARVWVEGSEVNQLMGRPFRVPVCPPTPAEPCEKKVEVALDESFLKGCGSPKSEAKP